jgi:hypothetical protein
MPAQLPSLEPPGDAVKQAEPREKSRPGGRLSLLARLTARHLEGWEPFGITVGLVLAVALLAVPRAAPPGAFPVPLVDVAEARATREHDAALAEDAERHGLPFETRAVGDAVRRLGMALSGNGSPEHLGLVLAERVELALKAGQLAPLERLRAVQTRLFVRAVRDFSWRGPPSAELVALGGDFVERARSNGWVADDACIATDDELATLFKRRWADLTRLREHARFKASLGELRRYFRFLLLHPEHGKDAEARDVASARLRYVEALARYDGEYPASLARGALYGSLGMSAESAAALADHLARPPSGEWALLARNYLLEAARGHEGEAGASLDDGP